LRAQTQYQQVNTRQFLGVYFMISWDTYKSFLFDSTLFGKYLPQSEYSQGEHSFELLCQPEIDLALRRYFYLQKFGVDLALRWYFSMQELGIILKMDANSILEPCERSINLRCYSQLQEMSHHPFIFQQIWVFAHLVEFPLVFRILL
jgi:hypothetical protein